jgi:GT2 family glycosyltransferase
MPLSDPRPLGKNAKPHANWSLVSPTRIAGHVFDPDDPGKRFVVELLIDGVPSAIARADLHSADLARDEPNDHGGDFCHGFVFSIDPATRGVARQIEVRLANRGDVLTPPLLAPALDEGSASPGGAAMRSGAVRWLGGLRFNGWLAPGADGGSRIRAIVDGQIVAETSAEHWVQLGDCGETTRARGFDLFLPDPFADGRAREAQILDDHERELSGSPCAFIAFDDGLARFIDKHASLPRQTPRTKRFDCRAPQSLPFSMFAQWRERFPDARLPPQNAGPAKIAVALIGERDFEASVASLEAQEACDWVAAVLEDGEGETAFHNESLREFLDGDAKDCALVAFAPSGAVFQPTALAQLARALALFPAAPGVYGDFTLCEEDRERPVALSAFGYERMLEQGAGALLFALPTPVARAAVAGGAENLFRLFNFSQDGRPGSGARPSSASAATPVHQPGFLARLPRLDAAAATRALTQANQAHFSARRVRAEMEPGSGALFPAVRVRRPAPRGKVSVLIPTRDRVDLLKPCLESLFATADLARHEVIVLDNDSSDPETLAYFARIVQSGVRVLRVGGPFNFAKIINKGASIAVGHYLLLLNNDVEALELGWLEEMLGRMAEPDVGAVGATLLWPGGVVQHGGVVLGPGFAAGHAFNEWIDGDPGYADLLCATHEVSAVTAACLLTDRRLFLELGGFDGAHFPVNFNDVDYCLKLRAKGLRIVQAVHAKLLHRESASRGLDRRADRKDRFARELDNLRAIWSEALQADPYYNPALSLDEFPFSALAWPPRPLRARQNVSPPPRLLPPGF